MTRCSLTPILALALDPDPDSDSASGPTPAGQDGGAGSQGVVTVVLGHPDCSTQRSVVSVEWPGGQDNLYSR